MFAAFRQPAKAVVRPDAGAGQAAEAAQATRRRATGSEASLLTLTAEAACPLSLATRLPAPTHVDRRHRHRSHRRGDEAALAEESAPEADSGVEGAQHNDGWALDTGAGTVPQELLLGGPAEPPPSSRKRPPSSRKRPHPSSHSRAHLPDPGEARGRAWAAVHDRVAATAVAANAAAAATTAGRYFAAESRGAAVAAERIVRRRTAAPEAAPASVSGFLDGGALLAGGDWGLAAGASLDRGFDWRAEGAPSSPQPLPAGPHRVDYEDDAAYLLRRQRQLLALTQSLPPDERVWLALVQTAARAEPGSGRETQRAAQERSLALTDAGIAACPEAIPLHLHRARTITALHGTGSSEAIAAWTAAQPSLLTSPPFLLASLDHCRASAVQRGAPAVDASLREVSVLIRQLRLLQAGEEERAWSALCVFEDVVEAASSAGRPVLATAAWQALFELNVGCPPELGAAPWAARMAWFRAFWESEALRVGDTHPSRDAEFVAAVAFAIDRVEDGQDTAQYGLEIEGCGFGAWCGAVATGLCSSDRARTTGWVPSQGRARPSRWSSAPGRIKETAAPSTVVLPTQMSQVAAQAFGAAEAAACRAGLRKATASAIEAGAWGALGLAPDALHHVPVLPQPGMHSGAVEEEEEEGEEEAVVFVYSAEHRHRIAVPRGQLLGPVGGVLGLPAVFDRPAAGDGEGSLRLQGRRARAAYARAAERIASGNEQGEEKQSVEPPVSLVRVAADESGLRRKVEEMAAVLAQRIPLRRHQADPVPYVGQASVVDVPPTNGLAYMERAKVSVPSLEAAEVGGWSTVDEGAEEEARELREVRVAAALSVAGVYASALAADGAELCPPFEVFQPLLFAVPNALWPHIALLGLRHVGVRLPVFERGLRGFASGSPLQRLWASGLVAESIGGAWAGGTSDEVAVLLSPALQHSSQLQQFARRWLARCALALPSVPAFAEALLAFEAAVAGAMPTVPARMGTAAQRAAVSLIGESSSPERMPLLCAAAGVNAPAGADAKEAALASRKALRAALGASAAQLGSQLASALSEWHGALRRGDGSARLDLGLPSAKGISMTDVGLPSHVTASATFTAPLPSLLLCACALEFETPLAAVLAPSPVVLRAAFDAAIAVLHRDLVLLLSLVRMAARGLRTGAALSRGEETGTNAEDEVAAVMAALPAALLRGERSVYAAEGGVSEVEAAELPSCARVEAVLGLGARGGGGLRAVLCWDDVAADACAEGTGLVSCLLGALEATLLAATSWMQGDSRIASLPRSARIPPLELAVTLCPTCPGLWTCLLAEASSAAELARAEHLVAHLQDASGGEGDRALATRLLQRALGPGTEPLQTDSAVACAREAVQASAAHSLTGLLRRINDGNAPVWVPRALMRLHLCLPPAHGGGGAPAAGRVWARATRGKGALGTHAALWADVAKIGPYLTAEKG
jgi:hypothetical protein